MSSPSHINVPMMLVQHSPLLKLPSELRLEVYDFLGRLEPKSYPFGWTAIRCIDRRAPPTALIATCRCLHDEILTHFYNTVTFHYLTPTINHPPISGLPQIALTAVRQVKKFHLGIHWKMSGSSLKKKNSEHSYVVFRWLEDITKMLLREAKNLETVTIAVFDLPVGVDWECKKSLLDPLKILGQRAVLRLGEITTTGEEEEVELTARMKSYLDGINKDRLHTSDVTALDEQ
ncbi:hypothetical protein COCMIDRAFT_34959 [Bipolaris oryzae ATCC 44560]|uniref:Uncharacterized protein n=1 Tax=Bipolaris oryzae ATCC 44560 TaxID=930090 RepID=W6Z766_COCMI|nr:uncharacterized protein COCMIDRAFT_34959 [Bipolaris oryzae ATCC 44560]EUC47572.1 hypothetical protein COCMIDRAFT_34959 [Bipolaris oryzae ATCC 44560]